MSSNTLSVDLLDAVTVGIDRISLSVSLTGAACLDTDLEPLSVRYDSGSPVLSYTGGEPVEVELSARCALHVSVGAQGPAGASGTGQEAVHVPGFDTSGVTAGRMVYASGNYVVAHTDAASSPEAKTLGAFDGQLGRVQAAGVASLAFVAGSPTPSPGDLVFLARADSETGAAGKVSVTAPAVGFVAAVGLVVNVPNTFTSTRSAAVLLHKLTIVKRG